MAVLTIFLIIIGIIGSTAVGCNIRAQECAHTASDEKAKGAEECKIIKQLVGCLSSIPATGCSASNQAMIVQILQQTRQQEHTACNETVATTEAAGCYIRTQECAHTAHEEKTKGIALCTIYKNLVECFSSIPITRCSSSDKMMIAQALQQAQQQEHTACNETITTTEAVGCYTKVQECGTRAEDEKGSGLNMCTVANNLMKCLSSIPLSQCLLTTKSLIAQAEQQAQQAQHKYCGATTRTPTTTQFVSCYTKLEECETRAADDKKTGLTLCTIYTGLMKCLSSISIARCSMTTQTLIAQAEQQAQSEIHKYCGEIETTTLPTTPKLGRCTLEERVCSKRKQSQIRKGQTLCSANLEFVNCLNKITTASCINGEKLLIEGYLDESNRYIINCPGSDSRIILPELTITVLGVVASLVYLY